MKLKNCKVGDLVVDTDISAIFEIAVILEIVAVNEDSVNLKWPKNSRIGLKGVKDQHTTFMFVNPKHLRRVKP